MSLKIGKYIGSGLTGLNGIPTTQIKETLDVDYKDITGVQNWMSVGVGHYDYLYCRTQVKVYVQEMGGFSGLTSTKEQEYAAKHFLVAKTDRDSVMTEELQYKNWGSLVSQSKANRDKRWANAKTYAAYVLAPIDSLNLGDETEQLSYQYKELGKMSLAVSGVDGLLDWIQGTSTYVGSGMPSKSYHTQELEDKLVSILTNGY